MDTEDEGGHNIRNNVAELIEEDPNCEISYKWLIYRYWYKYCALRPGMTFDEVRDLIASPESIGRARRIVLLRKKESGQKFMESQQAP